MWGVEVFTTKRKMPQARKRCGIKGGREILLSAKTTSNIVFGQLMERISEYFFGGTYFN